jgi:hypothetical protein
MYSNGQQITKMFVFNPKSGQQNFPHQGLTNYTKIIIFGMKISIPSGNPDRQEKCDPASHKQHRQRKEFCNLIFFAENIRISLVGKLKNSTIPHVSMKDQKKKLGFSILVRVVRNFVKTVGENFVFV